MKNLQLEALANALSQWGLADEIWGTARDAARDALVHGAVRNYVLVIDEAIVLEHEPMLVTL